MNRDIVWTTQFKKDYKLALKRHLNIDLLDDIIRALSRGETLVNTVRHVSVWKSATLPTAACWKWMPSALKSKGRGIGPLFVLKRYFYKV